MDGVILINKQAGLTSADVIRKLKPLVKPSKIGHAGTLDPDATGLLVVLVGKATRLQPYFMGSDKSYEGVIRLGLATDSDDISGRIIEEESPPDPTLIQYGIDLAIPYFLGEIKQTPPKFSAVKINGKRAYDLARRGEEFETKERTVNIKDLKLSLLDSSRIAYQVTCSSGTYVRSLARDLGKFLKTVACAESIRRTLSGHFCVNDAIELDEIFESNPSHKLSNILLPLSSSIVKQYHHYILTDEECADLQMGNQSPLAKLPIYPNMKHAAVVNQQKDLISILQIAETEDESASQWKLAVIINSV